MLVDASAAPTRCRLTVGVFKMGRVTGLLRRPLAAASAKATTTCFRRRQWRLGRQVRFSLRSRSFRRAGHFRRALLSICDGGRRCLQRWRVVEKRAQSAVRAQRKRVPVLWPPATTRLQRTLRVLRNPRRMTIALRRFATATGTQSVLIRGVMGRHRETWRKTLERHGSFVAAAITAAAVWQNLKVPLIRLSESTNCCRS